MTESPLVTTEWLAEHLDDPGVRLAEIQYEPDIDEYRFGHIPGAMSWFWRDMFWHDTERQFPTPEEMSERLGRRGVDESTTLVLYSGRNQYAAYGYWVAKVMAGHPDVRVLDGSRHRWVMQGRMLTGEVPTVSPVTHTPQQSVRDDSSRVGREDVLAGLDKPGRVLIDARYPPEYKGDRVKPGVGFDFGAERYGRIPGAVSLTFKNLFDPDELTIKQPDELEAIFRNAGAAPDQADEVIAYCRLSHRACLIWFAATQVLGWDHVRVYDGSWTEWGSMVGVPIEK